MATKPTDPPTGSSKRAGPAQQPFKYPLERAFVEPDWTRLPGYRGVSKSDWENARWQRQNSVKNLAELKEAFGHHLPDTLAASIERDQRERATMSILVTPQMINTMNEKDLWGDPVRRYMWDPLESTCRHASLSIL